MGLWEGETLYIYYDILHIYLTNHGEHIDVIVNMGWHCIERRPYLLNALFENSLGRRLFPPPKGSIVGMLHRYIPIMYRRVLLKYLNGTD